MVVAEVGGKSVEYNYHRHQGEVFGKRKKYSVVSKATAGESCVRTEKCL